MADNVKQEIKEGAQAAQTKPAHRLLPLWVIIAIVAVCFIGGAGAFVMSGSRPGEARPVGGPGRQDPDLWRESAGAWCLWDLGTVWVCRRGDKNMGERKITASFALQVSKMFLESVKGDLQELLKRQIKDLIQSILHTREAEVRKDPRAARLLLQDDILRGLKMGANPNDPQQKTYEFPFNDENLGGVFVEELQETRW